MEKVSIASQSLIAILCDGHSCTESCISNTRYSVDGASIGCCTVDGSTCGVSCDLGKDINNATINATFTVCFGLTNITLHSDSGVSSFTAEVVLVENHNSSQNFQLTSQDVLTLNRTFVCVTSLFLRLRFQAASTSDAVSRSVEFFTSTCSKLTL